MHRHRRKQTAEVFELELCLLRTDCPNLGAYTSQQAELFPESALYCFLDNLKGQGTRRVKNLGNGPNACLRGFYYYCLKSIYDNSNKDLLQRFKQQLYPNERNLTAVTSLPDHYMELTSNQMKKLMVEFIHVLSYSSERNKVESYLNKYPVIEVVMLLLVRAILRDCKIEFADQYDKQVDWIEAYIALGDIFGIDLRFVQKMQVCDFVDRQFFLVRENDTYFMVYFDPVKTEKIDLNELEFDSVSVSQPSDKQGMDKSDGSTPKFKLYIDSHKKRRGSHKNSFGGEIDIKAHRQLSSSTIFNQDSAFGEIIKKHRLSEPVDNESGRNQRKHSKDRKGGGSHQDVEVREHRRSKKPKRSSERAQRSPSGPRFIENSVNIDLEGSQIEQPQPKEPQPHFKQSPPIQAPPPQQPPTIFRWDERSSFSQLAGLRINSQVLQILKDNTPPPPQNQIRLAPIDAVSVQPGSPTNTNISVETTVGFGRAVGGPPNQIQYRPINASNIETEMTCSSIIDMLEPSVRESLKMRKLSMHTDFIKSNIRKLDQIKSSLIVEKQQNKPTQPNPNGPLSQSMINVVNMPLGSSSKQDFGRESSGTEQYGRFSGVSKLEYGRASGGRYEFGRQSGKTIPHSSSPHLLTSEDIIAAEDLRSAEFMSILEEPSETAPTPQPLQKKVFYHNPMVPAPPTYQQYEIRKQPSTPTTTNRFNIQFRYAEKPPTPVSSTAPVSTHIAQPLIKTQTRVPRMRSNSIIASTKGQPIISYVTTGNASPTNRNDMARYSWNQVSMNSMPSLPNSVYTQPLNPEVGKPNSAQLYQQQNMLSNSIYKMEPNFKKTAEKPIVFTSNLNNANQVSRMRTLPQQQTQTVHMGPKKQSNEEKRQTGQPYVIRR